LLGVGVRKHPTLLNFVVGSPFRKGCEKMGHPRYPKENHLPALA
jgi:hypothetical protein